MVKETAEPRRSPIVTPENKPKDTLKVKPQGKSKVTTVNKLKSDPSWRPIMFSRNTAMFTIPITVRDTANLIELYYQGLGAVITYNETNNTIEIKLGVQRPVPQRE